MSAYTVCAAVTAISACISLGFALEGYVKAKGVKGAGLSSAMFTLARSAAIALAVFVPFFLYSLGYLAAVAIIMIMVQTSDALIGLKAENRLKIYGPLLTAIANLGCLIWVITLGP